MDKVNMCQIQKQIDNSKEEMMGVISFISAIFPLSFVINSYLVAMKNIGENQGTENIRTVFFYVLIFLMIIPGLSEPPVRTLRATIPENENHIFR